MLRQSRSAKKPPRTGRLAQGRRAQPEVAAALVERVYHALASRKLGRADLTARTLGQFLGQTTSVLYHHFGSLEGFLYAVSIHGFTTLTDRLDAAARAGADPAVLAQAYLGFALDHPVLYQLMMADSYDWDALGRAGQAFQPAQLRPWNTLVDFLRRAGSPTPELDAGIFQSTVHGVVLLTLTGRITTGAPGTPARDVATAIVSRLVHLLLPRPQAPPQSPPKATHKRKSS
ncbi:MAG: TetR/AcrR family transcriptional regulator [Deltaproteobacteria bacterium]|nr:TetR/AcrR family transcriptional regulator [Deltaproteobacteria bacterium]